MAVTDIDALRLYQEALAEYDRTATDTSLFGKGYRGIETDFDSLITELKALAEIDNTVIDYGNLPRFSADKFVSEQSYFMAVDETLKNVFATSAGAEERLTYQFNAEYCNLKNSPLHALAEKCSNCLSAIDCVDNWWEFSKLLKKMQALDLNDVLNHILDKRIAPEHLASTYKKALENNITMTGTNVDYILEGINKYLMTLAKEQIKLAFEQSEKEVMDLRQRTKEGMETARLNGKQIGQIKGTKLTTKKSIEAKEQIQKYSKDFRGTLKDTEVMKLVGLARNTYYKYKRELVEELNNN